MPKVHWGRFGESRFDVAENSGAWVFNGEGQMVQPAQLAEADFGTIGTVRIVPGLVGGL